LLDRRQFLASTYGAALLAERRIVSRDPLEAETDLAADVGPYTPVDDFFVRNHLDEPGEMAKAALRKKEKWSGRGRSTLARLAICPA
jgi:hypothetical protein